MRRFLLLSILLPVLLSCEDVVEIDTPEEEPRLIIEALIRLNADEDLYRPIVKVSLTSSFFGTIPLTGLNNITITNLALPNLGGGNSIILEETSEGSGMYQDPDPVGLRFFEEGELLLQLSHEGRLYFARTHYAPSVPIDNLIQGDGTLFNDDGVELEITITDHENKGNFYVVDFDEGEFLALEDKFVNGRQFTFSFFPDRTIEPGEEVTVSVMGADRDFFNYMDLLIEQTIDNGGVFETPIATVRGNIFDVTDLDNIDLFDNVEQPEVFPLGYFAVVQEYKRTIIIQ